MRQQGQTEMDNQFQEALGHLQIGTVTRVDWEFFQSRVLVNLPLEDQDRFQQSTFLFTRNVDGVEQNTTMLEQVSHPNRAVAKIEQSTMGFLQKKVQSSIRIIVMGWNISCMSVSLQGYLSFRQ